MLVERWPLLFQSRTHSLNSNVHLVLLVIIRPEKFSKALFTYKVYILYKLVFLNDSCRTPTKNIASFKSSNDILTLSTKSVKYNMYAIQI